MKLKSLAFVSTILLASAPVNADEQSDLIAKGKAIANKDCSRCHVVDPADKFSGISSTPSFKLMVTALDDWEERFSSFHVRLPHPSIVRFKDEEPDPNIEDLRPPVILDYDDIDALVAYARTFAK